MSERFGGREGWAENLKERRGKLDRAAVAERLASGEDFESVSVADLDLSGLSLEGKSFRMADVRGLHLFNEATGETANIKNTDWTDADVADLGSLADFSSVEAAGARFGFTEKLKDRKARYEREGKKPDWDDCGGLHNFVGNNGNFPATKWSNIDFGGRSSYEAVFFDADLMDAEFIGCDLAGMDLSRACLTGVKIIDPESLLGMQIYEKFVAAVARGVAFSDPVIQANWQASILENGEAAAVERFLGINIVPLEN